MGNYDFSSRSSGCPLPFGFGNAVVKAGFYFITSCSTNTGPPSPTPKAAAQRLPQESSSIFIVLAHRHLIVCITQLPAQRGGGSITFKIILTNCVVAMCFPLMNPMAKSPSQASSLFQVRLGQLACQVITIPHIQDAVNTEHSTLGY